MDISYSGGVLRINSSNGIKKFDRGRNDRKTAHSELNQQGFGQVSYRFYRFSLMPRLLLLRHAKAGWAAPGVSDFERTLTQSGRNDARKLGLRMRSSDLIPDLVLCSPAKRAVETLEFVASTLFEQPPKTEMVRELYNSDAADYLQAVREASAVETLLVVGHNPMMEDLAYELPSASSTHAIQAAASGFPTCGLAVISFDGPLKDVRRNSGQLETFLKPNE
ncbi:SixA phosphatase family protein [Nitratireductor kimnyeongensis]|uniref:SixA phosphatase family protein n=1 Tax=Nitratireductor kimnyeongensis TaxID=430679 RepID=A0ABW0TBP7_9HYPH